MPNRRGSNDAFGLDASDKRALLWAAVALAFFVAGPFIIPGQWVMGAMILLLPGLLSGYIVVKMAKIRQATHWPSTSARVTRSEAKAVHSNHSNVTEVRNRAAIEYEFKIGTSAYKGSRVRIEGDVADNAKTQKALDRYPVGANVPVYYNPENPEEVVLERDPPLAPVWMYTIAAGIFLAGLAVAAVFAHVDEAMVVLRAHFPEGAEPHLAIFSVLCAALVLWISLDNVSKARRAKGWPTTEGWIVTSRAESFVTTAGSAGHGPKARLYQPVVEYRYTVGGHEYHSTMTGFGPAVSEGQSRAEARASRYPEGSTVAVHYDPAAPAIAVIETQVSYPWLTGLLVVAFAGLAVYFSGVFHARR